MAFSTQGTTNFLENFSIQAPVLGLIVGWRVAYFAILWQLLPFEQSYSRSWLSQFPQSSFQADYSLRAQMVQLRNWLLPHPTSKRIVRQVACQPLRWYWLPKKLEVRLQLAAVAFSKSSYLLEGKLLSFFTQKGEESPKISTPFKASPSEYTGLTCITLPTLASPFYLLRYELPLFTKMAGVTHNEGEISSSLFS